ncbi:MAG: hypothetical protein MI755_00865 [Sphingomonadales bacterium]|nr:hypothetical protein [Sphingomonadales bacterium]
MTRVSSFGHTQAMINSILSNQQRVFTAQKQVNSGRVADEFRGFSGQTTALLGAQSLKIRTDSYTSTIKTVNGRLEGNDVQLEGILEQVRELRQAMLVSISEEKAFGFEDQLKSVFNFTASALNTNIGGVFIFAGSKTDVPPVSVSTVDDLLALATSDDAFENDNIPSRARVADNVEVDFGLLADDIASEVFASIRRIAEFHNGPSGPLDGELDSVQRAFLVNELPLLDQAIQQAQSVQVRNGIQFGRLETLGDQHADSSVFLETFIADIQDVDIAEAVTRLNNDQLALQASYQLVGQLADLSLLNFL